jgi:tetratricopeptide (TPR) repeat protein
LNCLSECRQDIDRQLDLERLILMMSKQTRGNMIMQQQDSSTGTMKTADILCSAKAKYRIGDYQGAIAEYTVAIELAPNIAIAYSCRGDAYAKLGEVKKAMADYDYSTQIDPTATINYYRRGNLHYYAKNYALALAEYSHAIELKPDFALAYLGRGYANRELYGDQEGLSDWDCAARLFEDQGNPEQYKYVMDLIDLNMSIDTLSGMLF